MKPVVLHCEADVELTAAAKRYACVRPELARDFLRAFRAAKDAVGLQPDRIVYEELDDCVQVLAVMHDSREPDYWKSRLS